MSHPPATRQRRERGLRLDSISSLVLVAMAAGLALRFIHLGDVPPAMNQDEAVNGYDAYSLALTGRDHHGHLWPVYGLESYGDWVSPLLTFLTAPVVGVFGLSVVSVRAASAVLGVVSIPAMYLLGVELLSMAPFLITGGVWIVFAALYPRRPEVLRYFQSGQEQAMHFALEHEADYDSIWLAGGNQTYVYLLFHGRWPPGDAQRLRLRRVPGRWNA